MKIIFSESKHGYQTIDIVECAEETDNCVQHCINTAGSYTCDCDAGYRLDSDGWSCNGKINNYVCPFEEELSFHKTYETYRYY